MQVGGADVCAGREGLARVIRLRRVLVPSLSKQLAMVPCHVGVLCVLFCLQPLQHLHLTSPWVCLPCFAATGGAAAAARHAGADAAEVESNTRACV